MQKSKGAAILHCKCPKCREGGMFKNVSLLRWFDPEMNETCPNCGQIYEPEPGFFYGAMFVSYAFSVAITFSTGFILYYLFNDPALWIYMVTVTIAVLLMWPLMYRYSRSVFLHLFGGIRFNPKARHTE